MFFVTKYPPGKPATTYQVTVREKGSVVATVTVQADFGQQAIAKTCSMLGHHLKPYIVDDKRYMWTGYEYFCRIVQ